MKYLILVTLIACLSCSSDDDVPPPKPNSAPGSLNIDAITFDGKTATIDWSDAKDPDGDQVFYKLYINSVLIGDFTESIGVVTTLDYNNIYNGIITATDKRGGATDLSFEFSSPKSKILFYSEANGNLTAYDLFAKSILWQKPTSYIEAHTIFDGLVYSGLDGINGLDILTGDITWTSTPSRDYNREYRSIIADESNVYAFDVASDLYCVDRVTGVKKWSRSFLNYYAPLSIDAENVYVCSRNDDNIYAINKITGETVWSFELDSNNISAAHTIDTNPLVVDGNIYFGDNIGTFYSFNTKTGVKNWDINAGQFNSFYPSPTIFNETIIVGTYSNLFAYNLNGSVKWGYTPNGSLQTSPFIYNEKVYIGVSKNGSGELLCLNANDGSVIWRFDLENNTTSSPIVYEDVVYIGDWNQNFYAVMAETGILEWKIKTDEVVIKSPTIAVGNGEIVIYPSSHGLSN